jgi:CBS domain-containing protein
MATFMNIDPKHASDSRFDELILLMTRFKLRDLSWRIHRDSLVTLDLDDTIRKAINTLSRNKITSAPCFDNGRFVGFCDMQQLVRYVSRLVTGKTAPDGAWWNRSRISTTTVRDLVCGRQTNPILGEYATPISENASLYQAFEQMAREGQHRIAVEDINSTIVGVVCQSEIIDFLHTHMTSLGPGRNVLASAIRPYNFVTSINKDALAFRAFELMDQLPTSMNGIPVVDEYGVLCDVISSHDLRGILPGSPDFNSLWGTVENFKDQARFRFESVKYLPKTVKRSDTLETIINIMQENSVKRVFVVDDQNRPLDVITQTDIFRYLLGALTNTW